jgi:hypothetical protein
MIYAAGDKTTHIYQGNTLAIVKAVQKKTVGDKKVMIFTPGYRCISVFDSLLAPERPEQPHTSLSGLRTRVPSALNPKFSTAAFHASLLLYLSAISSAF